MKHIKLTAIFSLAFISMSCHEKKDGVEIALYWKFKHVNEIVSLPNEDISFELSDQKISNEEVDSLVCILKQWQRDFYVTTDSVVFVKKVDDEIILDMKVLDDELYTRMGDTTVSRTFYR